MGRPLLVDDESAMAGVVGDPAPGVRTLRLHDRRLTTERSPGSGIVGESAALRRLIDAAARIAPRDITVLIRGETGTGKELVAALVHAGSRRAGRPLVRFNCAAIPGELAEAELFGHVRGAFTGATEARRGFFAEADGGTLVLDEIGELTLPVQAKLLRAVQEGEIQPVGAGRIERVDVRVIACTNRDLAAEARAGRFREDLYYRLAVVDLVVPPLRDRPDDIPALARHFARRYADRFNLHGVHLSPALLEALQLQDWPGNIRQLENTIARLVALSSGGEIGPQALAPAPATPDRRQGDGPHDQRPLRERLEVFERGQIEQALAAANGNQSEAARRLRVSRSALVDRLRKYGLV